MIRLTNVRMKVFFCLQLLFFSGVNVLDQKSLEGGTKFVCQHGPQECKGNRILSCALKSLPSQKGQVEYVNCFMETFKRERNNPEDFGQVCALQYGLDISQVIRCYNNEEGTIAQLKAQEETTKILPKFIPTILYNGQFDQELQDKSLTDFKRVICSLTKNYPEVCQTTTYL